MTGLIIAYIVLLIGGIFCVYIAISTIKKCKQKDIDTELYNQNLQTTKQWLEQETARLEEERRSFVNSNKKILQDNEVLIKNKEMLIIEIKQLTDEQQKQKSALTENEIKNQTLLQQNDTLNQQITTAQQTINAFIRNQEEVAAHAFSTYCEGLETAYNAQEAEYDELMALLHKVFEQEHDLLSQQFEKEYATAQQDLKICQTELDKIRATRAAAQEAILKEREIKEQRAFYSLPIADTDLADIKALESVKARLTKPRILSMLIWQTYYQKPMTQLCNNILGVTTVCGIYKITNQLTDQCYIGQSVDIASRWKDHAKCGLGIDTPSGNKLYAAMIQDGLWNFTFELLEKCERTDLDAKEKQYIEIYEANIYGYNITKGNK